MEQACWLEKDGTTKRQAEWPPWLEKWSEAALARGMFPKWRRRLVAEGEEVGGGRRLTKEEEAGEERVKKKVKEAVLVVVTTWLAELWMTWRRLVEEGRPGGRRWRPGEEGRDRVRWSASVEDETWHPPPEGRRRGGGSRGGGARARETLDRFLVPRANALEA